MFFCYLRSYMQAAIGTWVFMSHLPAHYVAISEMKVIIVSSVPCCTSQGSASQGTPGSQQS